eukprot:14720349-Alexandrium_andersonii.AAC.1
MAAPVLLASVSVQVMPPCLATQVATLWPLMRCRALPLPPRPSTRPLPKTARCNSKQSRPRRRRKV